LTIFFSTSDDNTESDWGITKFPYMWNQTLPIDKSLNICQDNSTRDRSPVFGLIEVGSSPMPETILIVEDQELVRRALRKLLEVVYSRYHVIEATNGEEAVGLTKTEQPHLVIMDITLPGMSGIEATQRIRAAHPTIPVIMLTIHEDQIYREEAEAAGAVAYVPKRAIQSELLPKLAPLLADLQEQ